MAKKKKQQSDTINEDVSGVDGESVAERFDGIKDSLEKDVKSGVPKPKKPPKPSMPTNGKLINSEQLEKSGMMQEFNRLFFNPIGLEFRPMKSGRCAAYVLVDRSDDIENLTVNFGKNVSNGKAINFVAEFQSFVQNMNARRKKILGYIKQPIL